MAKIEPCSAVTTLFYQEDNRLNGPRCIESGFLFVKLFIIPRADIETRAFLSNFPELTNPCLYFLLGELNGVPTFHIGNSNTFKGRSYNHKSVRKWWHTAYIFVAIQENGIIGTEAEYLEHLAFADAIKAGNYRKEEGSPEPGDRNLKPEDKTKIKNYYKQIQFLTEFVGCNIFKVNCQKTNKNKSNNVVIESQLKTQFHIKGKVVEAFGSLADDNKQFIIHKGSTVAISNGVSCPNKELRAKRISESAKLENGVYRLVNDVICKSPYDAATFVFGTNRQGINDWKDENNVPIKKYLNKQ